MRSRSTVGAVRPRGGSAPDRGPVVEGPAQGDRVDGHPPPACRAERLQTDVRLTYGGGAAAAVGEAAAGGGRPRAPRRSLTPARAVTRSASGHARAADALLAAAPVAARGAGRARRVGGCRAAPPPAPSVRHANTNDLLPPGAGGDAEQAGRSAAVRSQQQYAVAGISPPRHAARHAASQRRVTSACGGAGGRARRGGGCGSSRPRRRARAPVSKGSRAPHLLVLFRPCR